MDKRGVSALVLLFSLHLAVGLKRRSHEQQEHNHDPDDDEFESVVSIGLDYSDYNNAKANAGSDPLKPFPPISDRSKRELWPKLEVTGIPEDVVVSAVESGVMPPLFHRGGILWLFIHAEYKNQSLESFLTHKLGETESAEVMNILEDYAEEPENATLRDTAERVLAREVEEGTGVTIGHIITAEIVSHMDEVPEEPGWKHALQTVNKFALDQCCSHLKCCTNWPLAWGQKENAVRQMEHVFDRVNAAGKAAYILTVGGTRLPNATEVEYWADDRIDYADDLVDCLLDWVEETDEFPSSDCNCTCHHNDPCGCEPCQEWPSNRGFEDADHYRVEKKASHYRVEQKESSTNKVSGRYLEHRVSTGKDLAEILQKSVGRHVEHVMNATSDQAQTAQALENRLDEALKIFEKTISAKGSLRDVIAALRKEK